jgi:Protein of unknown function (DUF5132)
MGFLFGILLGAIGVVTLKDYGRPLAKGAVKSGIRLARIVQEAGAEVAEEFSDIKAEAEADLEVPETAKPAPKPKPVQ